MFVVIFESLTKLPHVRFYPRSPEKGVNGVHPLVTIVMLLKVRTCLEPVSDYMYSKIKYSIRRVTLTCTWQHKNK